MNLVAQIAQPVVLSLALFIASMVASAGITYLVRSLRSYPTILPLGTPLRIQSASGVYRSRLVDIGPGGWLIDAPMHANRFIPLPRDERLRIEASTEKGAVLFVSEVIELISEPRGILIQCPEEFSSIERRDRVRYREYDGERVTVNGYPGVVRNLSRGGAMILTREPFEAGDAVTIQLPHLQKTQFGWVLEALPDNLGDCKASRLRICFAESHLPGSLFVD